jgi:hypothetical protein
MRNEVLAKERDMERAGGHNMVHGGFIEDGRVATSESLSEVPGVF